MMLKNKVALITGASRGIGLAIAERFEKEGAQLVLTVRQNINALKKFTNAKVIPLDLNNRKDIDKLVTETIKEFGRIDILVNNAAVFKQTEFNIISEDELDAVIEADLKSPFLLLQKVFSQMQHQKEGRIINISSGAAKLGSTKAAHYAACKAALIALTKSLAKLGGAYNINVNAVAPGFIQTDMIKEMLSQKKEFIESIIPLARIGLPQEVAAVVLFLASPESGYVSGQTLCVDGGHCMI